MKQTQYLLKITALLAFLVSQSPASSLVPIGDSSATLTLSGSTVTRSILTSASGRSGALPVSKTRTAFIQFNLSGSGFSKGSYDKARLTLFFPTVTKAGTLELRLIDESWDESFPERTRPTPAVGSPFTIIQEDSVVRKQFVVVDVTDAMTDALSNGRSVFGIAISSVNGVANVVISSKEGTGTGHAPELQLIPNMTVTPGVKNMAVGPLALGSITSGENNTALGHLSMLRLTTGLFNTAIGTDTLKSLVNGSTNTATGYAALASNVSGNGNTANGFEALGSGTTGSNNTAMGHFSLVNNSGHNNTAIGSRALLANTTANGNTAIGRQALEANTTGSSNTASGYQALGVNTTGGSNTASGYQALGVNTTGSFNTASGYQALAANTTGGTNTAIGPLALRFNTTGSENTASGYLALYENRTGSENTAVGWDALRHNWTGNENTAIGHMAGPANNVGGSLNNTICVGNSALATQSNMIRLGNSAITYFSCNVGLSVTSDRNLKENFLPVDGAEVLEKIKEMPMTSWNYIGHDAKAQRHYGPMAQDFYAAFGTDAMGTIGSPTTVNTNDMAGVTFSAIQQLTKENEDYKQQLQTLKEEIDQIRQQIGRGSN